MLASMALMTSFILPFVHFLLNSAAANTPLLQIVLMRSGRDRDLLGQALLELIHSVTCLHSDTLTQGSTVQDFYKGQYICTQI